MNKKPNTPQTSITHKAIKLDSPLGYYIPCVGIMDQANIKAQLASKTWKQVNCPTCLTIKK